jgi:pyruvate kinase
MDQKPSAFPCTKIVATIGPASESPEVLEQLIRTGLSVARLNFSHGKFEGHERVIANIRKAEAAAGRRIAIMADLPGPKMRIGEFGQEKVELRVGERFTLTTEDIVGDAGRVSVSFARLPQVVKAGDLLSLNDGYVQLEVTGIRGPEVPCVVKVGGELRSRKGLNLPGIDLGTSAFTDHDRACLRFALEHGVDAISQSFVEGAADIRAVREAAREIVSEIENQEVRRIASEDDPDTGRDSNREPRGKAGREHEKRLGGATGGPVGREPFLIAKIERVRALDNLDEILDASDGVMIARGDLGVEVPIERIALVQKDIMRRAGQRAKPVITATQMLESMISHRLPTRAEATDVANAILDGTDCVMLSGESAIGAYPVESVAMLAKIAAEVEPARPRVTVKERYEGVDLSGRIRPQHLAAISIEASLEYLRPAAVFVPSASGATARRLASLRLPVPVVAVSASTKTCQGLHFSYGVVPVCAPASHHDWGTWARAWVRAHELAGEFAILIHRVPPEDPSGDERIEILTL